MKCENSCGEQAEVSFNWLAMFAGPQKVCLCQACGEMWWSKYKHTHAGETLIIEDLTSK